MLSQIYATMASPKSNLYRNLKSGFFFPFTLRVANPNTNFQPDQTLCNIRVVTPSKKTNTVDGTDRSTCTGIRKTNEMRLLSTEKYEYCEMSKY